MTPSLFMDRSIAYSVNDLFTESFSRGSHQHKTTPSQIVDDSVFRQNQQCVDKGFSDGNPTHYHNGEIDMTPTTSMSARTSNSNGMMSGLTSTRMKNSPVDLRRQFCDQNVFIFHLPAKWTEEDLRREFGRHGPIATCKVVKRPNGTSKGYGFVCYVSSESAFEAVKALNGQSFDGKRLKVSLKKTPEECLHQQIQKLIEMSSVNHPHVWECTLFVFHVPPSWEDKDLYMVVMKLCLQHFQSFGTLLSAKIAKKNDDASRGYGFITYDSPRAAALAIANMNGAQVGQNKRLKVQLKQQNSSPQPLSGCTIFIFHLPSDWTDNHLRQHFGHFGKILGATVQRNGAGNSRGYGFVSFEKPYSALNAVVGMNGFSVGYKRLKVSPKREDSRFNLDATKRFIQPDKPRLQLNVKPHWDDTAQFAATQTLQQPTALPDRSPSSTNQVHPRFALSRPLHQTYANLEASYITMGDAAVTRQSHIPLSAFSTTPAAPAPFTQEGDSSPYLLPLASTNSIYSNY